MTDFSEFLDIYLDDLILGFPCYSSPRFSTTIAQANSGSEDRTRHWMHPLRTFRLPKAIREHPQYEAIQKHWLIMGGPERAWPFTDPLDFASCDLETPNIVPDWSASDQLIGVGDGFTKSFQLTKTYEIEGETYVRPIYLPQADEVEVLLDGLDPSDLSLTGGPYTWTVSRPGGMVTFTPAPAVGLEIRAGFLFDVMVRFEADDSFDGIVESYQVSGVADLTLSELRPCE